EVDPDGFALAGGGDLLAGVVPEQRHEVLGEPLVLELIALVADENVVLVSHALNSWPPATRVIDATNRGPPSSSLSLRLASADRAGSGARGAPGLGHAGRGRDPPFARS